MTAPEVMPTPGAGHFPRRGRVADHFPREGRSLPQEDQVHQKGPYLKLPEKSQNVPSYFIGFLTLGYILDIHGAKNIPTW